MSDRLLDSDVIIEHLRGATELRPGPGRDHYSPITRAELFAGPEEHTDAVRALLGTMIEVPLDGPIAERAGRIRRATGIGLPDALIAASALALELPLLTRNRRDFARVEGLELLGPG